MDSDQRVRPLSIGQLLLTVFYLLIFPALLLGLAGDFYWIEAWVFSVVFIVLCCATVVYLYFKDPALLQERYSGISQKGQKSWDKIFLSVFVSLFFLSYVIMPLDARRYHWSPEFPTWIEVTGAIFLALAFVIIFEVFRENTFAAPVVRVQEERRQKVISSGLYGIVRHPMYVGAVFLFFGVPMLLGSIYGIIIGFAMTVMIAIRSIGEEKVLTEELDGYQEYTRRVRWRLIPSIF